MSSIYLQQTTFCNDQTSWLKKFLARRKVALRKKSDSVEFQSQPDERIWCWIVKVDLRKGTEKDSIYLFIYFLNFFLVDVPHLTSRVHKTTSLADAGNSAYFQSSGEHNIPPWSNIYKPMETYYIPLERQVSQFSEYQSCKHFNLQQKKFCVKQRWG